MHWLTTCLVLSSTPGISYIVTLIGYFEVRMGLARIRLRTQHMVTTSPTDIDKDTAISYLVSQ